MFIAALFIIAKNWNQPRCLPMDKWMTKLWYIHTMEYDSAIKRKKLLMNTTTWVNLKDIVLSERSRSQKVTCCMFSFIWHSRRAKL